MLQQARETALKGGEMKEAVKLQLEIQKKPHAGAPETFERGDDSIFEPLTRKPFAQITGYDVPPGIDRDRLAVEFEGLKTND